MAAKFIKFIVWIIEKIPFLKKRIVDKASKKDDDIDPNMYTLH